MNNTKWNKIFEAFYGLECSENPVIVPWMTKSVNGFVYGWDVIWTHFGSEPTDYKEIEWLKIKLTPQNREQVIQLLKEIHVPGELLENEVIIYGHRYDVDYI